MPVIKIITDIIRVDMWCESNVNRNFKFSTISSLYALYLTWLKNKKGCCISHWMTATNLIMLNKFCAIFASFPGTYILPLHLGILVTVYLCVPCIVERKRMRNNNENRKYEICFHFCLSYVSFASHNIRFANSTLD